MQKFLITGFSGFVGYHFMNLVANSGERSEILGIDLNSPNFTIISTENCKVRFERLDLLNKKEIENILILFRPDFILHLASFSSVAYSWENPVESFVNNTNIFLNVIEAVRRIGLKSRVLSIGSSEEYGNVTDKDLPISEDQILQPLSPYAVARVSQEMLTKIYYASYGLDIILTRSFNHIGPEQSERFVISSFAKQLVRIKQSTQRGTIETGDISIVRDFIDVRDVVRAYHTLFLKGKSGDIYNICSGNGVKISDILNKMIDIIGVEVDVITNKKLIRPNDNRVIIGSNEKIKREVEWNAKISIEQSLKDTINYWENK